MERRGTQPFGDDGLFADDGASSRRSRALLILLFPRFALAWHRLGSGLRLHYFFLHHHDSAFFGGLGFLFAFLIRGAFRLLNGFVGGDYLLDQGDFRLFLLFRHSFLYELLFLKRQTGAAVGAYIHILSDDATTGRTNVLHLFIIIFDDINVFGDGILNANQLFSSEILQCRQLFITDIDELFNGIYRRSATS